MPELNPLSNDQIFLKKIAENTGSDYNTGDVSEINPLTIDQILLKEIAGNTAGGGSGGIQATQDMISAAYDSTHTYNVGDYCIHENVLYKCNTASTTGTWDPSKWDAVTVAHEVADNTSAIEAMVNVNGSKNILPNNATSKTDNGINFVVNANGSVTISNTATAEASLVLFRAMTFKSGSYILSKFSDDSYYNSDSDFNYFAILWDSTASMAGGVATSQDVQVTIEEGHKYNFAIYVASGTTISTPITFYPMLRDARISDNTYAPYAMTNRELTEDTAVLTATPSQSDYLIAYPDGFTLDNSMIVSAQYKSSTRGFPAFDYNSSTFPMPYYHENGIAVNPSNVDTTLYTKLVICLKKIR